MRFRTAVASTALAFTTTIAPAALGIGAQALAACPEVGQVYYSISNGKKDWKPTNLRSDYLTGPGAISYTKTATSETNASLTGTTTAEAGAIFAKASVSLGVQVGKSWSKSDSWSYRADVPAGQTRRLQQYKEARSFRVKKTTIVAPCNVKTVWTKDVVAPVKNNNFLWKLTP